MELWTNFILTLIFMSMWFLIVYLKINTRAINENTRIREETNNDFDYNSFTLLKLQLQALKKQVKILSKELSTKIKSYD